MNTYNAVFKSNLFIFDLWQMFQAYNSLLKVSQVICFWREKIKEEVSSAHNNSNSVFCLTMKLFYFLKPFF